MRFQFLSAAFYFNVYAVFTTLYPAIFLHRKKENVKEPIVYYDSGKNLLLYMDVQKRKTKNYNK